MARQHRARHHWARQQLARQQRTLTMRRLGLAIVATLMASTPALAQPNCRNTADFGGWLAEFKREARAKGISQQAIDAASPYLVLDQRIIHIDRGQRFFAQTFLEISDKM